jgi:hypothetical protein
MVLTGWNALRNNSPQPSRVRKGLVYLAAALAVWCATQTLFAGPPGRPKESPTDFAEEFARLRELGLVDVKDAVYVNLHAHGGYPFRRFAIEEPELTGNAWLVETKSDGRRVFLVRGYREVEVYDVKMEREEKEKRALALAREKDRSRQREMVSIWSHEQKRNYGTWRTVDPSDDAKKIIRYLQEAPKEPPSNVLGVPRSDQLERFFLFACHLQRKGVVVEANRIAQLLLARAGDKAATNRQVRALLADEQYRQAFETFQESSDWREFSKALDGLLARFPDGWQNGLAVKKLAKAVHQRLTSSGPPPIAGKVTEEDRKLARDLAEWNGNLAGDSASCRALQYGRGCWFLAHPSNSLAGERESPMMKILRRGLESIPLLIALLDDPYLVAGGYQSTDYFGNGSGKPTGMEKEDAEELYQRLPRPSTRGEIAAALLDLIVWNGRTPPSDDTRTRRARSLAWYEEHKGQNRSELLHSCLEQGEPYLHRIALEILLESEREEDWRMAETSLLEFKDVCWEKTLVVNHVLWRGAQVREFVEKYAKRILSDPKLFGGYGREPDEKEMRAIKQEVDRFVAELENLISSKTTEDLLARMLASKGKWTHARWSNESATLVRKLSREEPDHALQLLLAAIPKTEDPTLAGYLLYTAAMLPDLMSFTNRESVSKDVMETLSPGDMVDYDPLPPVQFDLAKSAALWRKLLADQRRLSGDSDDTFDKGRTVSGDAAEKFEALFNKLTPFTKEWQVAHTLAPDRMEELTCRRVEARLAGVPESRLPSYPSTNHVSSELRARLREQIGATDGSTLRKSLDALTLDECLVLRELADADEAVNRKLIPLANEVREVRVTIDESSVRQACERLRGKSFDRQAVETLFAQCLASVKAGRGVLFSARRRGFCRGTRIGVNSYTRAEVRTRGEPADSRKGMISGLILTSVGWGYQSSQAFWPVQEAPASMANQNKKGDSVLVHNAGPRFDEENSKSFCVAVERMNAPNLNACEEVVIRLVGPPPSGEK